MNPIVLYMQLMIVISLLHLVATTTNQQLTSHSKEQITVSFCSHVAYLNQPLFAS